MSMSVMSVIKVIILKARYKILVDSVCKQVVSITLYSRCLSLHQFIFF